MNRYFIILSSLIAGAIVYFAPLTAPAVEFQSEGVVVAVSKLPDPKKIAYPDCNYSVTFELFSGQEKSPKEYFVAVVPGIRKLQLTSWAALQKGEKYRLTLVDEDELDDAEKSIQIVDDNEDFKLPYFYLKATKKVAEFSLPTILPKQTAAADEKKVLHESPEDEAMHQKFIDDELKRVKTVIVRYDPKRVEQALALLSTQNKDNPLVHFYTIDDQKKLTLLWEDADYLHSVFTPSSKEVGDSVVASIGAIHDFFARRGTRLIVVPLPEHAEAALDQFLPAELAGAGINLNRMMLIQRLLEAGIETVDVLPEYQKVLHSDAYWYQEWREDQHFCGYGYYLLAKLMKQHVAHYQYANHLRSTPIDITMKEGRSTFYWQQHEFSMPHPYLSFAAQNFSALVRDEAMAKNQNIQIIGDSFVETHFPSMMSYVFETKISSLGNGSAGPIMARLLQIRRDAVSGKAEVAFFIFLSSYIRQPWSVPIVDSAKSVEIPKNCIHAVTSKASGITDSGLTQIPLSEFTQVRFHLNLAEYVKPGQKFTLNFYLKYSTNLSSYAVGLLDGTDKQVGWLRGGKDILTLTGLTLPKQGGLGLYYYVIPKTSKGVPVPVRFEIEKITLQDE